jgi:SAM-dependent methyltransferase
MISDFWDERYSSDEYAYGKEPNNFLKQVIDTIPPGRILLPGEGEGRNAVFAAKRGWFVDAFDTSQKGMQKALTLAKENGVKITYTKENILFFQPKTDFYNLTALLFLHLPRNQRRVVSVKLWESMKPGAKFIMEVFSKEQLKYSSGGPKEPDLLYTEEEVLTDFPCFKPELLETKITELNEGKLHKGMASVIRFIGTK